MDLSPRLHQTVIAICAHRGCRPQPSRANGGIPLSLKAHPGVVPDGLAPAGIVGIGMAAPRCASGASSQGLSTPQSAWHSNQMTVLSVVPGWSVAQDSGIAQSFFAASEESAPDGGLIVADRRCCLPRPNVGANRPAEAGGVSLARDSGEAAARQAYTARRSGSG